jgi:SAM-dependent methyltransferase
MINQLHSYFFRPENGWDPVSDSHATAYAQYEWSAFDLQLFKNIQTRLGSLTGKDVLDLGGGPGQYATHFALDGANVSWYDISQRYRTIAQARATSMNADILFHTGYLDDAAKYFSTQKSFPQQFDLVWCRLCWYYGKSDYSFAENVYQLVKPGGWVCIINRVSGFSGRKGLKRIPEYLNDWLGIKIGHPYPPKGRIPQLFEKKNVQKLIVEYPERGAEFVWFQR